jgi:hypothetical protein
MAPSADPFPAMTPTHQLEPAGAQLGSEICPRCEEGMLVTAAVERDLPVFGSTVRLAKVQVDECPRCGYRALSGRETRLFEVVFARQYERVADLVQALRDARYLGMFLKQDLGATALAFSAREYVDGLATDLRELYLDNESGHVLGGLAGGAAGTVRVEAGGRTYGVRLPKMGEGENGVVFDIEESPGAVFKLAKPREYSRAHVRDECEITSFFSGHGVPVPAVLEYDRYGSYCVKERLAGESLAVIYGGLGPAESPRHQRVRETVRRFCDQLIELFGREPHAKTSISPNNIFVVEEGAECRCLLVDTGPAPMHDYSSFSFDEYWGVVVPQKIARYKAVGYI